MREFGELEAAVMQVVWSHDEPVTVRAIAEQLNETRPLAYTTVSTIVERLRAKGVLTRVWVGRSFQYAAVRSADAHTAQLLGEALRSAASPSAVFMHFAEQLDHDDAVALRAALDQRSADTAGDA
jgi:predicted transcriptional regulator